MLADSQSLGFFLFSPKFVQKTRILPLSVRAKSKLQNPAPKNCKQCADLTLWRLSLTRLVEYWRWRLRAKFDALGFRTLRGGQVKAKEQKRFFFLFSEVNNPIHHANQKQPTRINKMRRMSNAEQVTPSRRSLRRRKRNDQLNDYDVCMNGPGRRGKEYKMCKNLMNSFNERRKYRAVRRWRTRK